MDRVIFIEKGEIKYFGSFDVLSNKKFYIEFNNKQQELLERRKSEILLERRNSSKIMDELDIPLPPSLEKKESEKYN